MFRQAQNGLALMLCLITTLLLTNNFARAHACVAENIAKIDVAALSIVGRSTFVLFSLFEEHVIKQQLVSQDKCLLLGSQRLVLERNCEDVRIGEKFSPHSKPTSRTALLDHCDVPKLVVTLEARYRKFEVAAQLRTTAETHGALQLGPGSIVGCVLLEVKSRRTVPAEKRNDSVPYDASLCWIQLTNVHITFLLGRTGHDSDAVEAAVAAGEAPVVLVAHPGEASGARAALGTVTDGRECDRLPHVDIA